jgi:hypothetical protein
MLIFLAAIKKRFSLGEFVVGFKAESFEKLFYKASASESLR